jgi:hypothetical protein
LDLEKNDKKEIIKLNNKIFILIQKIKNKIWPQLINYLIMKNIMILKMDPFINKVFYIYIKIKKSN